MTNQSDKVDQLMEKVDHPQKEAVEYLRSAILQADPKITEQVKWNAPSFCYDGVDRVTFQLKSTDIQLILHRGAKVKDDTGTFSFVDDTGLMQWRSSDRAVVTFKDLDDIKESEPAFIALVKRWVKA
ncbi:DUF1801 domain-containing protein [Streptomyces sp. NBC_01304]|uniref:DUF1801 domain-containing protein n=1 Tax=Streptomyces sp. NBC_01304 TaxID=2903818 RepID=UPI002E0E7B9B|nr:DUF1801 domain-containing protein [Streptomyces sp. NBC_01304]